MTRPVNRDDVQRLVASGAQLVEVLPEAEYAELHIDGAVNLPLREMARRADEVLDRSRPVIAYCHDAL